MKSPSLSLLKSFTCVLTLGALSTVSSLACTSLILKNASDGYLYGRTMEFGVELDDAGVVIPRKFAFEGETPDGKPGLSWESKYAVIGINAFDMPMVVDGLNEKGMAGGILYFPGYAEYTQASEATTEKTMAPWQFLAWALSSFETVDEVKAAVKDVQVVAMKMPHLGIIPPFHYTLHDANGKSIVIEPTNGELKVYDNPFGVMTNAPTFDWHLTNLRNYVMLSPYNIESTKINGVTVDSFGQGSGWLGIPGDPTPPSRFIRAMAFSMTTDSKPGGIESVRLVEHIMNNFDIPYGSIRDKEGENFDYTQWTAISDMEQRVYYVKTYTNPILRSISFDDFDLNAKEIASAPFKDDLSAPALFKGK